MDGSLTAFLHLLHGEGREFDQAQPDRVGRRRNLEPDTAALLALLVRAVAPHRILELGTSNGYSTIWLADAARTVGAELTSVEIESERIQQARANLEDSGLATGVELHCGDAATVLAAAPDAAWDLIFLDAERPAYASYWPQLLRVLAPGGLLAVDNVVSHAGELTDFRALVAADAQVEEALASTGAGLLLVVKAR
jgi:predicted O-methyltransferase YrrM